MNYNANTTTNKPNKKREKEQKIMSATIIVELSEEAIVEKINKAVKENNRIALACNAVSLRGTVDTKGREYEYSELLDNILSGEIKVISKAERNPKGKNESKPSRENKNKNKKEEPSMVSKSTPTVKADTIAKVNKSAKKESLAIFSKESEKAVAKAIKDGDRKSLNKSLFAIYRKINPEYVIGKSDHNIYREFVSGVMDGKINVREELENALQKNIPAKEEPIKVDKPKTEKEPKTEKPKAPRKKKGSDNATEKPTNPIILARENLLKAFNNGEISASEFTKAIIAMEN